MICVVPLGGLTSAQVQGEIMSFHSVLGIMMVAMRMDEVMLFVPCRNHGEGEAWHLLSTCGVSDVLGTLTSCLFPLNKQIPGIPFRK